MTECELLFLLETRRARSAVWGTSLGCVWVFCVHQSFNKLKIILAAGLCISAPITQWVHVVYLMLSKSRRRKSSGCVCWLLIWKPHEDRLFALIFLFFGDLIIHCMPLVAGRINYWMPRRENVIKVFNYYSWDCYSTVDLMRAYRNISIVKNMNKCSYCMLIMQ